MAQVLEVRELDVERTRKLIRGLIIAAKRELEEYRMSRDAIWLIQAAEKVWVAFWKLIEIKAGRIIVGHGGLTAAIRSLARKDRLMLRMRDWSEDLHIFHYSRRFDTVRIENEILPLSREVKKRC